jgi:hypothetical protein
LISEHQKLLEQYSSLSTCCTRELRFLSIGSLPLDGFMIHYCIRDPTHIHRCQTTKRTSDKLLRFPSVVMGRHLQQPYNYTSQYFPIAHQVLPAPFFDMRERWVPFAALCSIIYLHKSKYLSFLLFL